MVPGLCKVDPENMDVSIYIIAVIFMCNTDFCIGENVLVPSASALKHTTTMESNALFPK